MIASGPESMVLRDRPAIQHALSELAAGVARWRVLTERLTVECGVGSGGGRDGLVEGVGPDRDGPWWRPALWCRDH
jgi:hypothetical protein